LRHTFATELANANVSVYTLMKLLDHESMSPHNVTSMALAPRPVLPPS
jgi:site-specific recombinase XerD